ncbi:hypothetical protein E3P91_01967 [Wallemia ichthyophaga]|nr:hypothetical protein E3P91_01967 [Wallemia ichthyophaga]
MKVTKFTNCVCLQRDGSLAHADVYVDTHTGKIISGQDFFYAAQELPSQIIDCAGDILSPGLIDVQINGAYGFDFSLWPPLGTENLSKHEQTDAYLAGLDRVAGKIVETGTTSFLPTIITQQQDLYREIIPLLGPRSQANSAHILGYHAEGPFIAGSRKGAHAPPFLLTAPRGLRSIEGVYDSAATQLRTPDSGVKLLTLAPDVDGIAGAIAPLAQLPGVVVSIGHSDADVDLASKCVDDGARFITHLFNAMPQLHHRDPGVIGLLGNQPKRPFYGLIVDGVHVHPNAVRLAYDAHPSGCILVTDAMPLMDPHLGDGIHDWRDGRRLFKQGARLYLENTTTLAGSASTLDECVRNLKSFTNSRCFGGALACASYHPASLLQLTHKGNLDVGSDGDLVIVDRYTGKVKATYVKGESVYRLVYSVFHRFKRVLFVYVHVCNDNRLTTVDLGDDVVDHAASFGYVTLFEGIVSPLNCVCTVKGPGKGRMEVNDWFLVDIVEESRGKDHHEASQDDEVRFVYNNKTPSQYKLLDSFLLVLCLSAVLEFVYALCIDNTPYNAFLGSFISKVGQFILTVNLRIQSNPSNAHHFTQISPERSFADFVFASLLLHFCAISFLG